MKPTIHSPQNYCLAITGDWAFATRNGVELM